MYILPKQTVNMLYGLKLAKLFLIHVKMYFLELVISRLREANILQMTVFLEIEQDLVNLSNDNKYVCLMGDFNARTGHRADFFYP